MRQLKDLGLIIAYELHGFRIYIVKGKAEAFDQRWFIRR